jgi:FkbM family methyltransferase
MIGEYTPDVEPPTRNSRTSTMTSSSPFKVKFWQEVDDTVAIFIRKNKPVNRLHALRIQVVSLAYKILGHQFFHLWALKNANLRDFLSHFDIDALEKLYVVLGDEYSKDLLIKLMARKMVPGAFYLAPLMDKQQEQAAFEQAEGFAKNRATYTVSLGDQTMVLDLYDLSPLGYEINAYMHPANVTCTFMFEQYRYKHNNLNIGVENGDIAIDGGGCWGDTALYMAAKGAEKVYCFEFSEDNLKILNQNFAANPQLSEHITVVQKAIWNVDGVKLDFQSNGPATSLVEREGGSNHVETLTLDTLVEQMKIERIDFIKMDIEGAEMNALHGARKTIERFAPKLAITVYHKPEDLFTIPQFIKSLRADYTLYLDHFTSGMLETVLFAIPVQSQH